MDYTHVIYLSATNKLVSLIKLYSAIIKLARYTELSWVIDKLVGCIKWR